MLGKLLLLSMFLFAGSGEKAVLLHTYTYDVTGDGIEETIDLYGKPLKENKDFYEEVWAVIKGKQEQNVKFEGGFDPKLLFADFTGDGIKEMMYESATGGSGGLHNYAIYSFADWKKAELPLPEENVTGHFIDDFQAVIHIPSLKEPIQVDLKDRKADYIRLGIYQENGQLNEPFELMIDPINLMEIVENGQANLQTYQQISGAYHADGIGVVETIWTWKDNQWKAIQTDWNER